MSRVLAAMLLGAVLLAGCASPTPGTPTPTTLVPSSGAGLVADGTIDDPAGDLVDNPVGVAAKPVGNPAYVAFAVSAPSLMGPLFV